MGKAKIKNFNTKDIRGKTFNLYNFQDKSWLLLILFRGEWCQHCRKQLSEFNRNLGWFTRKKVKLLAVSADNALYTNILKEILELKFMILSDSKGYIFSRFGFERVRDPKKIKPALFLINPQHQIEYSYFGKNKKDRPSLTKLKRSISRIKKLKKYRLTII